MNKHLFALIPFAAALLVACGPKTTEVDPGTSAGTATNSSGVVLSSGATLSSGAQGSSGTVVSSGAVNSSGVATSSTGTSAASSSTVKPSSGATSSAGTSSVPGSSAGTSSVATSSTTTSSTTPSSSNVVTSSSSTTTSSSSWNPYAPGISYGTYTDTRDNKAYQTIVIGSIEYFAQNLDYGTQISGSSEQNNDGVAEKYCYNDDPANCVKYGGLYEWSEAMGLPIACNTNLTGSTNCPQTLTAPPAIGGADSRQHQGLCPSGWHIVNGDNWNSAAPGNSTPGSDFRAYGVGWSGNAFNSYGFSAVPSGTRANISPYFGAQGTLARWWTAVEINALGGTERRLTATGDVVESANVSKYLGLAIRCAKNY